MARLWTRRAFVGQAAGLGLGAIMGGLGHGRIARAWELPPAPPHTLTRIGGTPRERGRQYGRKFQAEIASFLEEEVIQKYTDPTPAARDATLRYADRCGKMVRDYSPIIWDELQGLAEGADLRVEEAVLITLHEELTHQGVLPLVQHCTAVAAGPPETDDGHTYVGQNWDWGRSLFGLSSMLLWSRPEGPSLLSYAYPGLWVGAGLNAAGIALCWTFAHNSGVDNPRIGIPSYVLLTQMLYQETLEAAIEEARRATQAGWFTFVLADGEGRIANVEGSPKDLVIERGQGHMARHGYGTRTMTRTPEGEPIQSSLRGRHTEQLLVAASGKLNRTTLQTILSDHEFPVCLHDGTIDAMIFDATAREAFVTRGPTCSGRWKRFGFEDA